MRPGGREGVDNLRKGPPRGIVGMRGGRLMPAPGESADFPALIPPMLAVPARELPAPEAEWAAEFKWDGLRAVAYVSAGGLRLVSRNGRDMTRAYPELAELAGPAGERRMVLDGEIVVFARGRPSFAGLQRRMLAREPAPYLVAAFAVTYLVFDIMYLDGQQLAAGPYADRRAILEALGLASGHVHVPPSFPGGGRAVRAVSVQQGLEGVVVKRLDSSMPAGSGLASPARRWGCCWRGWRRCAGTARHSPLQSRRPMPAMSSGCSLSSSSKSPSPNGHPAGSCAPPHTAG